MQTTSRHAVNLTLVARYQSHDRAAAEELLKVNSGMVHKIVRRVVPFVSSMDCEDLQIEAELGLLRAAELFDGGRGLAFSTYAVLTIRRSIQRAIQEQDSFIRFPAHIHDRRLTAGLPTVAHSLDEPVQGGDGARLGDLIAAEDDPARDVLAAVWIEEVLIELPPKERRIVEMRLNGVGLLVIAQRLQLSREGIRVIWFRSLDRLRAHLEQEKAPGFRQGQR